MSDELPLSLVSAADHGVSGVGTKAWGGEHGWGDYLIDQPSGLRYTKDMALSITQYSYDPLFTTGLCELTDFGWFFNTNNSSESSNVGAGSRLGNGIIGLSPLGTTIDNIYDGLKDFYRIAGYTNLEDGALQKMVGIVYHRDGGGANWKLPKGRLPKYWDSLGINWTNNAPTSQGVLSLGGLAFSWETIKRELDENRTVIACMQGWSISQASYSVAGGFPNTMHAEEKAAVGAAPDGIDYYGINAQASVGLDGTVYTPDDGSAPDAEHWSGGALGHTVLIVGYIPRGAADDVSSSWLGAGNGDTDWLIVRDNHQSSQRNVIIPWDSATKGLSWGGSTTHFAADMLMATIYVDPVFNNVPIIPAQNCSPRLGQDLTTDETQNTFGY
jgi:hypothetical protein